MMWTIKKRSLFELIICLLVFLVGIQYNNTPQIYVFILGVIVFVSLVLRKRIHIPAELGVLALSFTSYFIISIRYFDQIYTYHYAAYWLAPIVGYLLGYYFVSQTETHKFKRIGYLLFSCCSGTIIFAFACVIYKYINIGSYSNLVLNSNLYITMRERYSLNIWTGSLIHPTNLNSMCVFVILLFFYVLNYKRKGLIARLYYVAFACSLIVAFVTATRSNLVLLPVGLVISIYCSRRDIRIRLTRNKLILLTIIVCLFFVSSFKLIEIFENSLMATRTESLDNNRINTIIEVLGNMGEYPMGNMPVSEAHNMWVDVARIAGIIPMVLLIVYTIMILWTLRKLLKNKHVAQQYKTLFCVLTLGLLISFSIEPVITGRPFNLMFFCMINGMCAAIARKKTSWQR